MRSLLYLFIDCTLLYILNNLNLLLTTADSINYGRIFFPVHLILACFLGHLIQVLLVEVFVVPILVIIKVNLILVVILNRVRSGCYR